MQLPRLTKERIQLFCSFLVWGRGAEEGRRTAVTCHAKGSKDTQSVAGRSPGKHVALDLPAPRDRRICGSTGGEQPRHFCRRRSLFPSPHAAA